MAPVINLLVKADANIFIGDRYMAVLLLCWFGCEMNGVFIGISPLNVVGCCRDPQKAHPWPETRVLSYRSYRLVRKCDLGAWRRMEKEKKLTYLPGPPSLHYPTKVVM